ncbi:MAG: hypothetical protein M3Y87_09395 [Myxococcota bacterium]|nr:hypothetical protein [Myxococcota bacterium]
MQGFATVLLASVLLGTAPPPVEGCASLGMDLDLSLELEAAEPLSVRTVIASAIPLSGRIYTTQGWIGVVLTDRLAVLVDLSIGGQAMSPDPARPDPRSGVAASLGIAIRSWDGIEI